MSADHYFPADHHSPAYQSAVHCRRMGGFLYQGDFCSTAGIVSGHFCANRHWVSEIKKEIGKISIFLI